jgi:hypothetical protein
VDFYRSKRVYFPFIVLLFFLFSVSAGAQSGTPSLSNLLIELWPEYDRPETLIIYRVELDETVTLPNTLTFRLPGHIERLHAVAYEQNGELLALVQDQIDLQQEGDVSVLTFPAQARRVQFEYYDPEILTRENQNRRLAFNFVAPYEVTNLTFDVQVPLQAENFSLTPEPTGNFTSQDGFTFYELETAGVAAGEPFELTATYSRNTDEVSIAALELSSEHAADIFVAQEAEPGPNFNLAYGLISLGLLLLLLSGGSYLWTQRVQRITSPQSAGPPRPVQPRKKKESGKQPDKALPSAPVVTASFCYRCGTLLRPEANFCHVCGAERRKD